MTAVEMDSSALERTVRLVPVAAHRADSEGSDIEFANDSFDGIIASNLLENVPPAGTDSSQASSLAEPERALD